MNIMDVLKTENNDIPNKIAIRSEERKIKRHFENIIDDTIEYVNSESLYINNGFAYPACAPKTVLSAEEKEALIKILEDELKQLPSKLSAEISRIVKDKDENKEENKEATVTVQKVDIPAAPAVAPTPAFDNFGY